MLFRSQILKKSSLSELYEQLGCINTCLHKKDEALLCFSKAIELNPKSLSAYGLKAEYLYLTFKDQEAALNECEKALNLNIEDIQKDAADRLWVDDNGQGVFSVYENNSVISLQQEYANLESQLNRVAESYDINFGNTTLVKGDSTDTSSTRVGKVSLLIRNAESFPRL